MRVEPVSENEVTMQYEVYLNKDSTDELFQVIDPFFKQVENEDKYLRTNAQRNLHAGGYESGPLHPHNEKRVLHFKPLLKRLLTEHHDKEKELGREITPARRDPESNDIAEEELFCQDVCRGLKEAVGC